MAIIMRLCGCLTVNYLGSYFTSEAKEARLSKLVRLNQHPSVLEWPLYSKASSKRYGMTM
ncbi:hypothetical protein C4D60_Mb07t01040 [Musa balbisiana]|uniref:Uncharacterized protein n=1 Tax=Musa balbisiana TaxID=52838 RepID=A0A4S8JEL1_MUSBA|nr:hypothetical protein C4D60_Mb07t01040 [Musa balbisiana]